MNLSQRMQGRYQDDPGSGFRGNTADFDQSFDAAPRAGFGSEQNPAADQSQSMLSSNVKGQPHSSSGFRRALEHTERSQSGLGNRIVSKQGFGGKGYNKPNQFSQGGRRHGLHIGSGAPATLPAQMEGADTGV